MTNSILVKYPSNLAERAALWSEFVELKSQARTLKRIVSSKSCVVSRVAKIKRNAVLRRADKLIKQDERMRKLA